MIGRSVSSRSVVPSLALPRPVLSPHCFLAFRFFRLGRSLRAFGTTDDVPDRLISPTWSADVVVVAARVSRRGIVGILIPTEPAPARAGEHTSSSSPPLVSPSPDVSDYPRGIRGGIRGRRAISLIRFQDERRRRARRKSKFIRESKVATCVRTTGARESRNRSRT